MAKVALVVLYILRAVAISNTISNQVPENKRGTEAEDLTMVRSSSDVPEIDGLGYIQGDLLESG